MSRRIRALLVGTEGLTTSSLQAALAAQPWLQVSVCPSPIDSPGLGDVQAGVDVVIILNHDAPATPAIESAVDHPLLERREILVLGRPSAERHLSITVLDPAATFLDLVSTVRSAARDRQARGPSQRGHLDAAVALTSRELEVLHHLGTGRSSAAICTSLQISANTLRNHVKKILFKLGAHNRLEAVTMALKAGLMDLPDDAPTLRGDGILD